MEYENLRKYYLAGILRPYRGPAIFYFERRVIHHDHRNPIRFANHKTRNPGFMAFRQRSGSPRITAWLFGYTHEYHLVFYRGNMDFSFPHFLGCIMLYYDYRYSIRPATFQTGGLGTYSIRTRGEMTADRWRGFLIPVEC